MRVNKKLKDGATVGIVNRDGMLIIGHVVSDEYGIWAQTAKGKFRLGFDGYQIQFYIPIHPLWLIGLVCAMLITIIAVMT